MTQLSPEDRTWLAQIDWTPGRSVASLTARGARVAIPKTKGFYAFLDGPGKPRPSANCLYLGIAIGRQGLRQRLASYLRKKVDVAKASGMKHNGKKLLSYTRITGFENTSDIDPTDPATRARANTAANDERLHVSWAAAPLSFGGSDESRLETRRIAFALERALIARYQPLYNTADWDRWLELELDEDAFSDEVLD